MKKILIIYTAVGMGHKVVGENIARAFELRYPEVEVKLLNILKYLNSPFLKFSEKIYLSIITDLPWLWRFMYTSKWFNKLTLPLRIPAAAGKAKILKKYIDRFKPDLVVTTQTTATAAMAYLKKHQLYQGKVVTTFSDYHFQPYWYYEEIDDYLLVTSAQKKQMIGLGCSPEKLHLTGLACDDEFSKTKFNPGVYKKYNLSRFKPIVLVGGASRGWGISIEDIKALFDSKFEIQVVVVTGTDEELRSELREIVKERQLDARIFGWLESDEMAELFSIAKVLVAKPGGLTMTQAINSRLPAVFRNPLPGGEELNLEYLESRGIALRAGDADEVRDWVERLLQDNDLYQQVQERMDRIARPRAATSAAKIIKDML